MQLLAMGAHPDDIEIAAGATVTAFVQAGHEVSYLVLTDDPNAAPERRAEARKAANALGVHASAVDFLGLADGSLVADRATVSTIREHLQHRDLHPDVVLTHSLADSHNDHTAAARLAHAAFRESVILGFSVHVSAEVSTFSPRLFFEVTPDRAQAKSAALAAFPSQTARITRRSLEDYESEIGRLAGLSRAEGLEVTLQAGGEETWRQVFSLSESAFHRLWMSITLGRDIDMYYSSSRLSQAPIDWHGDSESIGRDSLRERFRASWVPRTPLRESLCTVADVEESLVRDNPVVLVGSAVANGIVRNTYNRLRGVTWVIEYEYPRIEPAFLYNRVSGQRYAPEQNDYKEFTADYFYLSRIPNPFTRDGTIVSLGGCLSTGTGAALKLLADPLRCSGFLDAFLSPGGVEMAFRFDIQANTYRILDTKFQMGGRNEQ